MLPCKRPDRIHVAFDDPRLVANTGLMLPVTLARRLGLSDLTNRHLDLGAAPGRANVGVDTFEDTLSCQYGLPVRTSRLHSHLLHEHSKNGTKRHLSRWQMSVTDFRPSYLCSLFQVQMGDYDSTAGVRMPVVKQDFPLLGVVDRVVVFDD